MKIRRAIETDLVGILGVYQRFFPKKPAPSARYEATIKDAIVLVADNEGEVVGFGVLRISRIEDLYILPEHQVNRLGSRVLQQLEDYAMQQDCKIVSVYAFPPNLDDLDRLIKFYVHRGYKVHQSDRTKGADLKKEL